MKIAIDSRCLTSNPVGVANYLISAVNHILKHDNSIFIYLLMHKEMNSESKNRLSSSENIKIIISPFFIFKNVGLLWFIFKINHLIRNLNVDYYWGPGQIIPFNLPKKIKTIVTIHDVAFKLYRSTLSSPVKIEHFIWIKHSIKKSDYIWCVSNFTKSEIEKYYPKRKCKSIFVGSSVEDKIFKPLKISENDKYDLYKKIGIKDPFILFVGTLEPRKNLKFLLNLMPELSKKGFYLAIVGVKGWGNTEISKIAKNPAFPNYKVKLTGYITTKELVQLYNLASVFVLPSLHEGFGLPVLEAMKCGCPVVTSHNSALVELVKNNGITVNNWKYRIWIQSIELAYYNNTKANLNDINNLYNWDIISGNFIDFIKQV